MNWREPVHLAERFVRRESGNSAKDEGDEMNVWAQYAATWLPMLFVQFTLQVASILVALLIWDRLRRR